MLYNTEKQTKPKQKGLLPHDVIFRAAISGWLNLSCWHLTCFHTCMTNLFKDQSWVKIQCISYYFWEGLGNKNSDYRQLLKMHWYQNSTNDLYVHLMCEHSWYKTHLTHGFLILTVKAGCEFWLCDLTHLGEAILFYYIWYALIFCILIYIYLKYRIHTTK